MKERTDIDIEFFQVLTSLFTGSNTLLRVPQNFELVNFLLLTSSWLVFYWHLHLIASCRQLSLSLKGHNISPHFRLLCRELKHQFLFAHAQEISELQFSLVILITTSALAFSFDDYCQPYLSIYLFIQFPIIRSITLHKEPNVLVCT